MVNHEPIRDPAKALRCKEKGNTYFQKKDYKAAEKLYSEAINYDPINHLLYTNRAMALLKLSLYSRVIDDAKHAISLHSQNYKAYFQLAQAQLALDLPSEALASAERAYKLCVLDINAHGKGGSSLSNITELVLKTKKLDWEKREQEREKNSCKYLQEVLSSIEEKRDKEIVRLENSGEDSAVVLKGVKDEYNNMMEETKRIWRAATGVKKRDVPEWCIDRITFSVMTDPVMTKNGHSYERCSILEHLKRSPTDPLTREKLCPDDLRENSALRSACQEFLAENGWATDW